MNKLIFLAVVLAFGGNLISAVEESGGTVIGDSVVYDSVYASLSVSPHTSHSPVGDFRQSFIVDSKFSGDLCIAYIFNSPLQQEGISLQQNTSYPVQVDDWGDVGCSKRVYDVVSIDLTSLSCEVGSGVNSIKRIITQSIVNGTTQTVYCFNSHSQVNDSTYDITYNDYGMVGSHEEIRYRMQFNDVSSYFSRYDIFGKSVYAHSTPLHFSAYDQHIWKISYTPQNTSYGKYDLWSWNSLTGDCVLDLQSGSYTFLYKLDPWYNSSFSKKLLINGSFLTDGLPFVVNQSGGLCDGETVVWSVYAGDTTSIYYNTLCGSGADIVVANETTRLPTEVVKGNGSDYLNTSVWINHNISYHTNDVDLSDSSSPTVDVVSTTGSPAVIPGVIGNAIYLDDTDYYEISTVLGDIKAGPFTIDFWMNHAQGYDVWTDYVLYFSDSGYIRCQTDGNEDSCDANGNFCCYVYDGGAKNADIPAIDLSAGVDYWVTWKVIPGANSSIYLNGVFKESLAIGSIFNLDTENMIGAHNSGSNVWNGSLDEIRVRAGIESDEETTQRYNNMIGTAGYGNLGVIEYYSTSQFSISLNSPVNNTITNDNLTDFNFTFSGSEATGNCILYLNNVNVGSNDSVQNNTATLISVEVEVGVYNWSVNCTVGALTNQSAVYSITILPPPSIQFWIFDILSSPIPGVFIDVRNASSNASLWSNFSDASGYALYLGEDFEELFIYLDFPAYSAVLSNVSGDPVVHINDWVTGRVKLSNSLGAFLEDQDCSVVVYVSNSSILVHDYDTRCRAGSSFVDRHGDWVSIGNCSLTDSGGWYYFKGRVDESMGFEYDQVYDLIFMCNGQTANFSFTTSFEKTPLDMRKTEDFIRNYGGLLVIYVFFGFLCLLFLIIIIILFYLIRKR